MSYNQSRVEKSDGQLRKSGGRSGHGRGFSGGGGGKGGGGGGRGPAHPHHYAPSSNQSSLSSNRSFKKSGDGQGGQPKISSAGLGSETSATTATSKTAQNGVHGQTSSQGLPTASMPSGPKQGDVPMSRMSQVPPKAPPSQSGGGISEAATPVKGDGAKQFSLQFGTISPGIVNGLQIPARTSSAPPNLDEQKRDQARHDSFRAVPTQPIPSTTKPQLPTARKDMGGVTQSTGAESHPPLQSKREMHQPISTMPIAPPPKSAAPHFPGPSMPMQFQQPPITMQYGGPVPQQMPMTLPIGNPPQVPQPMFVHNLQPHPLPPQAMIHQGQSLSFGPQITHHLGPQMGNIGISIAAPQFAQQQPPQGNFGVPRKTTVKITHPETREELRLDKKTDSSNDGAWASKRPTYNATPHTQPVASFAPSHYFPPLQPGSYSHSPMLCPPSTSVTTGSQPRYSFPVAQSGQAISFMNPSLPNPMAGSKAQPPVHGLSEPTRVVISTAPTQGALKPVSVPSVPKVVGSSVTISRPVNKIKTEDPRSAAEPTRVSLQTDSQVSKQPGTLTVPGLPPGTSLAPATPSESKPVAVVTNGENGASTEVSDSLKDNQRNSCKNEMSSSQLHQQSNEFTSTPSASSSLMKSSTGESVEDAKRARLSGDSENICQPSTADVSTPETALASYSSGNTVGTETETGQELERPGSSGVRVKEDTRDTQIDCADSQLSNDEIQIPKEGLPEVVSRPEIRDVAGDLDSAVSPSSSTPQKLECIKKVLEDSEAVTAEVSELSMLDSCNAKVHPVPTNAEVSEDVKLVVVGKQEGSETNFSEKASDTSSEIQAFSAEFERKVDVTNGLTTTYLELEAIHSDEVCTTVCESSSPMTAEVESSDSWGEINKSVTNIMEVPNEGSTPSVISCPKDKVVPDSAKAKLVTGKKKKRREILSKADAAGTSDLYNAYKSPEEKQQVPSTSEIVDLSPTDEDETKTDVPDKEVVANEEDERIKDEFDDWEDAAEAPTPKLENGRDIIGPKKYTRDFLLKFSDCTDLPIGFERKYGITDALMSVHFGERDNYPSPGRITDRSPRGDRRGMGPPSDDRWIKTHIPMHDMRADISQNFRPGQGVNNGVLQNPRGHPNQFVPILAGPMQSVGPQGGLVRNSSDADRWGRFNSRGIMLPPQTPLQIMHKAEKKYEVGKVSDEEQAKQRQLKGILNKLTPQNFDRLFQQVKEVNIDNTGTLTGVIRQIFDKALMEPTFCEMYANFCFHLSGELPDFTENDEKITFKRLLLNKCQEEFEKGEREQAEANRIVEEGEIEQSDEDREEKRIKARRRMLGNIRLIGELYKKKMLTERIMHSCIQKLLGEYENPDEEDLEALCKLMSTIGYQIDHPKAREHMDYYFDSMLKLSTNQNLSSRVRFMLRDVIDLRKNRWQQRRKVEGPKKIEEVHRDAAQERQSQTTRLSRGSSMSSGSRRGMPVDYGSRGSSVLPSPSSQTGRGLPSQTRAHGMHALSQRTTDESSITLGPQGGLARGMSIRGQPTISNGPPAGYRGIGDERRMASGPNGYSSVPDRTEYSSREGLALERNAYAGSHGSRVTDRSSGGFMPPNVAGRTQRSTGGSSGAAADAEPVSEEVLREKSISTIREFYSVKDEEEVALCVKELYSPSFYPSMVALWVTDSFEKKDMERDLLAKLLVNLCNSQDSLLSQVQLAQGFESVLATLEDAVNDAPRAAEFLARIFVKVILEDVVPLGDIGKLIHEGGEEPGSLVETGLASDVLGSILEFIKAEKGDSTLKEILTSSKLRLEDFRPSAGMKSKKKLDPFL